MHVGIENTLIILVHKLRNVTVTRDFDRTLPRLCAYGGELNQVWTNLVDNAIYAVDGTGRIDVRTRRDRTGPEGTQFNVWLPFESPARLACPSARNTTRTTSTCGAFPVAKNGREWIGCRFAKTSPVESRSQFRRKAWIQLKLVAPGMSCVLMVTILGLRRSVHVGAMNSDVPALNSTEVPEVPTLLQ